MILAIIFFWVLEDLDFHLRGTCIAACKKTKTKRNYNIAHKPMLFVTKISIWGKKKKKEIRVTIRMFADLGATFHFPMISNCGTQ